MNYSGKSGRIVFQDIGNVQIDLLSLKYEYTGTDNISKACAKKKGVKHKGTVYPDGHSLDMRFDMLVKNNKGDRIRHWHSSSNYWRRSHWEEDVGDYKRGLKIFFFFEWN